MIKQKFEQANRLQKERKHVDAIDIYREILAAKQDIPEVHFQIGTALMALLNFDRAASAFSEAAKLRPNEIAIWQRYAEAIARIDDENMRKHAVKAIEKTGFPREAVIRIQNQMMGRNKAPQPDTGGIPERAYQQIIQLLNQGQPDAALIKVSSLLKSHPKNAMLHAMRGGALAALGHMGDAINSFRQAIAIAPDYAEAHTQLGRTLLNMGQAKEAIAHLERARSLAPKAVENLSALGLTYFQIFRYDLAQSVLKRAVKLSSKDPMVYLNLAKVEDSAKLYKAALKNVGRAMSLGMKTVDSHLLRAKINQALGRNDDALEDIAKAEKLAPGEARVFTARALVSQATGDFDAANDAFLQAINANPEDGGSYRLYSASHKFTPDEPLITRMKDVFETADLNDRNRAQLGFALSKAMEDIGEYDQVFPYLNAASDAKLKENPYDIKSRFKEIELVKSAFASFDPASHPVKNNTDFAPVFVTGMPRSGTTLVEQIISTHSTMTGGGELGHFSASGTRLLIRPDQIRTIHDVTEGELKTLTRDFQDYVRDLLPGSDKITDKSIQTYLIMGLVWISMPKAKIIVVRRDPRDNLLSIYKNVFPDNTHLYSYDLKSLGLYYRTFHEMVEFWRGIAPERFHEIHYDQLIAQPEAESRKLIDACGLPWEDACLNFHQNKRRVDTLSIYQVRQPIYKSSLKGWKRYESELQPMFEALGDLLPKD